MVVDVDSPAIHERVRRELVGFPFPLSVSCEMIPIPKVLTFAIGRD